MQLEHAQRSVGELRHGYRHVPLELRRRPLLAFDLQAILRAVCFRGVTRTRHPILHLTHADRDGHITDAYYFWDGSRQSIDDKRFASNFVPILRVGRIRYHTFIPRMVKALVIITRHR